MVGLGRNKWHDTNDLTTSDFVGFFFKNDHNFGYGTNGLYVVEDASA